MASRTAIQVTATIVVAILVPFGFFLLLGGWGAWTLSMAQIVLALAYLLTVALMVLEARLARPSRHAPIPPRPPSSGDGVTTVLVAAYLPNEHDLIIETLLHLATQLDTPSERLQVLLAYNTPEALPVQEELHRLEALSLHVEPVHVPGSTSKAQNVMGALPRARGDVTVLLDADHHLDPDAIERARRWIDLGYDVVQGRCVVRNARDTWLTRLVAMEFEQIYAVAHTGRSLMTDTAVFGGTNGFWRTSVLRDVGMDPTMLTEDIDASLRTLLAGYRIVHDRSVISSELATPDVRRWWSQRMRWAQGWFQVTLRHQSSVWRSPHFGPWTKAYWTLMLSWRELFPLLSLQVAVVICAGLVLGAPVSWFGDPFLLATTVITLWAGAWTAWVAREVALPRTRAAVGRAFIAYALFAWPYTLAKNAVALVAVTREVLGDRRWVVTGRTSTTAPATGRIP